MNATVSLVELLDSGGVVILAIAGVSVVGWIVAVTVWMRIASQRRGAEASSASTWAALRLLACLAGVLPMLGLLGTVAGMAKAFGSLSRIAEVGATDLAGGIRAALVTTEAGLLLAIPLHFAHGWMSLQLRGLLQYPGKGGGE